MWLKLGGRVLSLRLAEIVIGRSGGCAIILDDPLVSRQHAKIVNGDPLRVVDLDSANGVFVNGDRVQGSVAVRSGDTIAVGQQELLLLGSTEPPDRPDETWADRATPDTLTTVEPVIEPSSVAADRRSAVSTDRRDVFTILGKLAERAIELGRPQDAERVLEAQLTKVLGAARATLGVDPAVAQQAGLWAIRLARTVGKGAWIDYVFALYGYAKIPLPATVIDELTEALETVQDIDLGVMSSYIDALEDEVKNLGASERLLVQRVADLARLAAR